MAIVYYAKREDVIAEALAAGVVVYAIDFAELQHTTAVAEIAAATGGIVLESDEADLPTTLANLLQVVGVAARDPADVANPAIRIRKIGA